LTVDITTGNFEKAISRLKRNKKQTLSDNSKEEKTRFELSREMIKRKIFSTLFCSFRQLFSGTTATKKKEK